MLSSKPKLLLISAAVSVLLSSCGGGGSSSSTPDLGNDEWQPGVFLNANNYINRCANPRPNTSDRQGSVLDENNFLRSYTNDAYLWYDEIVDQDPARYADPELYFEQLRTRATTASGKFKDEFSFSISTEVSDAQDQGISFGYGMRYAILRSSPPRELIIANVDPDTPAADQNITRGAELIAIDGVSVENGDPAVLNAGLFPENDGEQHTFQILDAGSDTPREITLTAAQIFSAPVQNVQVLSRPDGDVGYFTFFNFNAVSEEYLLNAFNTLSAANIDDLVIDLRYNPGGFSAISAQMAYMVAGAANTQNKIYATRRFNDKHTTTDPVTGRTITPTPFVDETIGFTDSVTPGQALPTLNLDRVFVLVGRNSCSAVETFINGLRGADVEVILVGETTCGKPFGFYGIDNCGITYFSVNYQSQNDKGFGDYADGFTPTGSSDSFAVQVPGCEAADDLTRNFGDVEEGRLSTALFYRENGTCPISSKSTAESRQDGLIRAPWNWNTFRLEAF